MPIYEFRCPRCRQKFEEIRPMTTGDTIAHCPECGELSRKVFSTYSFQFSTFLKELDKGTLQ